jgi:hypothetical protein
MKITAIERVTLYAGKNNFLYASYVHAAVVVCVFLETYTVSATET